VFEKDMIIFPININNSHWTCAAVNIRDKRFEYYDSLGGKMKKAYSVRSFSLSSYLLSAQGIE